ncbi:NAD(+) diphosphatase [Nocardioides daphniae]|uniref:NAD(+) diphosphatase n=1 Tax=Nocardioides daphniae TaxID=402297 RepID=A0A4V1CWM7_9ACTN|nr:NAD(+) diphosphatase [Nocardioides daphniae]QCC77807.1 NAD(+) diphosphatase [Nocardioides daphniae]GGD28135.1 NADH pyrophosphatase [Nocardioides daphniae]
MSRDEQSLPHVALSVRAHNREALHRTDAAWLDEQWADPATRVLVVSGGRVDATGGTVPWLTPTEAAALAPHGERLLLGQRDGRTRFALLAERDDVVGGTDDWVGLRGLFGLLAPGDETAADEAPWLFHAIGLAEWRRSHRFCPRCGGGLTSYAAGHELRCGDCGRSQFPRTDPAVIMTITVGEPGSDDEAVLLGRQAKWPATQWSSLAGFCEPGETLEDAVRRETYEETGVRVGEVSYFGSQPWPLPASLMVAFTGRATSREIHVDGAEIEDARWFTRAQLRAGLEDGTLTVPRSVSISASLLTAFHGGPLPGGDVWRR